MVDEHDTNLTIEEAMTVLSDVLSMDALEATRKYVKAWLASPPRPRPNRDLIGYIEEGQHDATDRSRSAHPSGAGRQP